MTLRLWARPDSLAASIGLCAAAAHYLKIV